jgi:hypothetical protein
MVRIQSKGKILLLGLLNLKPEYKEPIATDADTMWRTGMMALHGTYVPKLNIDKGNRS